MRQYQELLSELLLDGDRKNDRTGTGTRSIFGYQMRFDLTEGFPLVTCKKTNFKAIVHELLWFLSGNTNIKALQKYQVKIWNEWADTNGELGPIYGKQWRDWNGIDQIQNAIDLLKTDPDSRRNIVSAWNPSVLPNPSIPPNQNPQFGNQALAPCHTMFQLYVNNGELSLHMYQRSGDAFLGVPFNIASYALLLGMLAKVTELKPKDLIISFGDVHLYENHIKQATECVKRPTFDLPKLNLAKADTIFDFTPSHIMLENYKHHDFIPAPVAI